MTQDLPAIPLQDVKSSNVAALGYHAASERFAVQFKGGATYVYAGVSSKVADMITSADSVGSAVHTHLVNKYPFTKLDKAK
jgi:hypothetical protein